MNKLILLTSFVVNIVTLQAQVFIGPRAGVHFARADFDIDKGLEISDQAALLAGVALEFKLGENFNLQPELSYLTRGYYLEELIQGLSRETELAMEYIDLGALLKGKFGGQEFCAYLAIGAFHSWALSGELTRSRDGQISASSLLPDGNFDGSDITLAGGGGLQIGLGRNALFLDGRYLRGLKKMENAGESYPFTNRGLSVSTGLLFRL
ncbi:MAG: PorT family protein [Phaeodactylibacter sp.]|nr:PorT family protein [Phaeodactylibacter sp.]